MTAWGIYIHLGVCHLSAGVICLLQVFLLMSIAPLVFGFFRETSKFLSAIILYLAGIVCNESHRLSIESGIMIMLS